MSGQTISHYQILDKLGEGGMGAVYKARDTRLDRLVALKFLPAEKLADPERKARFAQEARAASALNHPNIITIHDIGEDFIVMEYVAGRTLGQVVPRKGLPLSEALRIAVQIADALAKAHAAGIVHRDLKPGNVMITEDGLVKVLDFGLAKLTEAGPRPEEETTRTIEPRTGAGTIVGTAGYMSPEQAEGKPIDARSDIFSFGSLLYEMVTGRRAFQGDSNMSTLAAIIHKEPEPLGADIPRDLERIIARCLRKDPARRWQTMADLKVALEDIKEELDSGKLAAVVAAPAARRPRRWLWAAAGVVAVVLAGGGWYVWRQLSRPLPPMKTVPLTTFTGNETAPAFSPDGNLVAYSWNGPDQDNLDIYVQQIGSGTPLRLTTHPGPDAGADWSPDGRNIVFTRRAAGELQILMVPSLGGAERKVGASAAMSARPRWSPDGRFLAFADRTSPEEPHSIVLLSLETGEKRKLTSPPQGITGDMNAQFAPDGRALLVYRTSSILLGDLYVAPLGRGYEPSGIPQRLTFDDSLISGFAWTPDSRAVVFSANRAGSSGLWRVVLGAGGEPERLAVGGERATMPALARQGNRLVYVESISDSNIWRVDVAAGGPPAQFIASTRDDESPQYSPDGRRIAFISARSGNPEVWVSDSGGGNLVQVTNLGTPMLVHLCWSPDGSRIAFVTVHEGRWYTHVVSAQGGMPRRLSTNLPSHDAPSWSRDGRWLYVRSEGQIWKVPAEGGQAVQVTQSGGFGAAESPDGKFLYYARRSEPAPGAGRPFNSIWRISVEGGEEVQVIPSVGSWESCAVTGRGIYFVLRDRSGTQAVHFYDFATGKTKPFFDFATGRTRPLAEQPRPPGWGLSVSPDGRYLLYTQIDQRGSDLMLVENFR